MKPLFLLLLSFCAMHAIAQNKTAADYGFTHITTMYKGDTVHVLIKSKKGEEKKPKPLFFFCQGSLPIPLIIDSKQGVFGTFPFNPDSLAVHYHLAIVGKPYVPLIADESTLKDFEYIGHTGDFPKAYTARNLLDYYVNRNIEVIKLLQKQPWISGKQLVVAGHSEGSTVVAKLAVSFPKITHAIYSGGNPMGRMATVVTRSRQRETATDSVHQVERDIDTWKLTVANPSPNYPEKGDSYKTTYDFSLPPIQHLQKLSIPVLVTYGTKDAGCPFNDYMRIEMIRQHKNNFTFKYYIGTEHNFFGVNPDGTIKYDAFNWDKVALDWLHWLQGRDIIH
jgi:pimeloyl-ACP methyl ester carboxylesterase